MEVNSSSQNPALSPSNYASDPEDKQISEGDDDDDDRNHKHRREEAQAQAQAQSESVDQVTARPFRKRNRTFENGSDRNFQPRFEKRRFNQGSFSRPPFGQIRGSEPISWGPREPRFGPVDLSSQMFNPQSMPWNAFGLVPGVSNGRLDSLHPLGALGPPINPSMNIGIPRQRCIDFEERGFCLRGDMCPMEHGVNRIVVEDVQSLSQFNLPGSLPVTSGASGSLMNSKSFPSQISKPGMGPNGSVVGGSIESDLYDPDQPLWPTGNPETSAALLAINQFNSNKTESFVDMEEPSNHHESHEEHPFRNAKDRLGLKQKSHFVNNNENDNGSPIIFKPQSDSGSNSRKPSQKAIRTLFVNNIPLKDNKKESLLSHFQKFGEVIDIYIPSHSERAFVQFSKKEEAEAAIKAPDAVMGNRFIRLWWANRDNNTNGLSSGASSSMPVTRQQKESSQPKHMVAANGVKAAPPPVQQKKLETLELLKEEIRKKQEMLDKKRDEFRQQLEKKLKLEKQAEGSKDVTVPSDHAKSKTSKSPPKANTNTENAKSAVPLPTTPSKTARATPSVHQFSPYGLPFGANRFKLDNRPTSFRVVSPLPDGLGNVSSLEEHFISFGDLSKVELEKSEIQENNVSKVELEKSEVQENSDDSLVPSHVSARISFTTRRSAEKAFLHGKVWKGHNLQFTWITSVNSGKESGQSGNSAEKLTRESDVGSVEKVKDSELISSEK